ncbi:MAG: hypothetical protein JWP60_448 [Ramlibacter sp.]|nr:hypothetical protein [Ramlibacter sp.]
MVWRRSPHSVGSWPVPWLHVCSGQASPAIVFIALWYEFSFTTALVVCACLLVIGFIGLYMARDSDSDDDSTTITIRKRERKSGGKNSAVPVRIEPRITYVDGKGETTTRDIRTIKYTVGSPGRIYAYCKRAKANRTFRTDRVREAIDLETGEVIGTLPGYMQAKIERPQIEAAAAQ